MVHNIVRSLICRNLRNEIFSLNNIIEMKSNHSYYFKIAKFNCIHLLVLHILIQYVRTVIEHFQTSSRRFSKSKLLPVSSYSRKVKAELGRRSSESSVCTKSEIAMLKFNRQHPCKLPRHCLKPIARKL